MHVFSHIPDNQATTLTPRPREELQQHRIVGLFCHSDARTNTLSHNSRGSIGLLNFFWQKTYGGDEIDVRAAVWRSLSVTKMHIHSLCSGVLL